MLTRITDGSTTITLSGDGAIIGCSYFPQPAGNDQETTAETIAVILEGTEAAIRAKTDAVEQLLTQASDAGALLASRVYLEYQTADGATIYRSELRGGHVVWSEAPGRHRLAASSNLVEVAVLVERLNFWEGPEAEVYLSSNTQSERVGGVAVYNNDNASNTNWVGIASNRITGNLPAPLRLRILNASGGSLAWTNFYIANNVNSAPTAIDCWLLGSEATGGASVNWSGSVTHSSLLYTFTLSSTLLGQTQGRYFRVLPAFSSNAANVFWRAGVYSVIGGVYAPLVVGKEWTGISGSELLDLGALPIPPGGFNAGTGAVALTLTARCAVGGSATLDFVQLMATDSFRRLEQIGYSLANGAGIEDNGIDGGAYALSGSTRYPILRAYHAPILVWPGRTQRLFILFDEGTDFVAGRQMTVSAWVRTRVRSV